MKTLLTRLTAILPRDPATAGVIALAALAMVVLFAFVFADAVILDDRATGAAWWTALPPLVVLLVMVLGGWRAARPGLEPRPLGVPGRKEIWALGAILVLGAVLRIYDLGGYPACVDLDTAMNGRISQTLFAELLRGEVTPVLQRWAQGNETAFLYVQGAFIKLFGVSVASLRLPSAMVGVLTLAVIFLLGRQLYSSHAGLAAAFLTAISPWHIDISRSPKRPVLTPLFVGLVLYFLCRALQSAPSRRSLRDFIICGVMVGLGLHGYEVFRLVPLAVTVILIWVRFRQGHLKKGLVELAVVGVWAMIMTLPIIVFALQHPGIYFHHVTSASAVGGDQQGSVSQLLASAVTAGRFFLLGVPVEPRAVDSLSAPLFAVTPLFIFGLAGLLAARQGPRAHRQTNTAAMLGTLVVMAVPILLTTLNLAPRRFTGLLVPFYLLAGGAAVGILRSVSSRWGKRAALAAGGTGVLLLLGAAANILPGMTEQVEGARQVRAAEILKYALDRAARREVYITPGLRDNHYVARFFLTHPRLWRLPAAWPLPQGPLARKVLVITDGEQWRGEMHRLYGAQPRAVKLALPAAPGDPASRRATAELEVFELDRERVRKLRVPRERLTRGYTAQLLVPRAGAYGFRVTGRLAARVRVGAAQKLLQGGQAALRVGLAGGLHHITFLPTGTTGPLQWQPPGASGWAPIPAGQLWRLPKRALPMAPRVASRARAEEFQYVGVGQQGQEDQLYLQGTTTGAGEARLLDIRHLPLKLWRGRLATSLDARPMTAWGAPAVDYYRQGQQLISHRVASSPVLGVFVLVRHRAQILHFDAGGKRGAPLNARLSRPADIAVGPGVLLVADPGLRAVLALDPGGERPARTVMTGVTPVSLALAGGRLAVLDRGRQRIVVRRLRAPEGETLASIPLPCVDDNMTLTMDRRGFLTLTQPHQKRVRLFTPAGELLASNGDPRFLDHLLDFGTPVAAHLAAGRLTILGFSEVKTGRVHIGHGK